MPSFQSPVAIDLPSRAPCRRAALLLLGFAFAGAACTPTGSAYLYRAAGPAEPVRPNLVVAASDPGEQRPTPAACAPSHRFYIPTGVEFAMPQDAFLFLAPNDWEDGVFNNAGAVDVAVEVASDKTAPAFSKQKLVVAANSARTPIGRLSAGAYLRVSVLGGTWNNDPGSARVGSEGSATEKCHGGGAHTCAAGEGRAPIMGLTLLMASCEDGGLPRKIADENQMVGAGTDGAVEADGELR